MTLSLEPNERVIRAKWACHLSVMTRKRPSLVVAVFVQFAVNHRVDAEGFPQLDYTEWKHKKRENKNGFHNAYARTPIKIYNFASKLNIFKNYV